MPMLPLRRILEGHDLGQVKIKLGHLLLFGKWTVVKSPELENWRSDQVFGGRIWTACFVPPER